VQWQESWVYRGQVLNHGWMAHAAFMLGCILGSEWKNKLDHLGARVRTRIQITIAGGLLRRWSELRERAGEGIVTLRAKVQTRGDRRSFHSLPFFAPRPTFAAQGCSLLVVVVVVVVVAVLLLLLLLLLVDVVVVAITVVISSPLRRL
jgi:hypothetical protein